MTIHSDFLFQFLNTVSWRFRLSRGLRIGGWGLASGSIISTVLFFCFPEPLFVFLPLLFALIFFAAGIFLPLSALKTARRIDEKLNLHNRIETALEIRNRPEDFHPGFAEVQRRDAGTSLFEAASRADFSHTFPITFSIPSLAAGLCFYVFFALVLVCLPTGFSFSSRPESNPTPEHTPDLSVKTPSEVLQHAAEAIEKAAEEYPQVYPVQDLNTQIRRFSTLSAGGTEKETLLLLRKWELEVAKTVEQLDLSSPGRRRFSGEEVGLTAGDQDRDTCLSLLREELGNIILCRLDLSDTVSQNGGEGARNAETGKNSWGSGESELNGSSSAELPDISELMQKGLIPALPTGEELQADPSGEAAVSETGQSFRGFSAVPEFPELLSVPPVSKREIPADMRDLVKRYFDY